jgi:hypothetical protein
VIELLKGPIPAWLETNQAHATITYAAAPEGSKPSPWRAAAVVEALKAECRNKCMYCEGSIDDVSYSAVEHIRPKKIYPDLVLEWTNLGIACQRCNTNKGEYWTDTSDQILLNPYVDAVADHLKFVGAMVVAVIGSSRGVNTLRKLKFDQRDDLVITKMKRIQEIDTRIRLWHQQTDPEMKALFAEDLREALAPTREYSATLVAFASQQGFEMHEARTN